jgi:hypothetical protein
MNTQPETAPLKASALDILTGAQVKHVAALVVRDNEGIDEATAVSITDEAVKFLVAASERSGEGKPLRPSRLVDMGWHALILHTKIYFDVCSKIGDGRYLHHVPEDLGTLRHNEATIENTVAAIERSGYSVNPILWSVKANKELAPHASDCMHSECHQDGGCTAPQ